MRRLWDGVGALRAPIFSKPRAPVGSAVVRRLREGHSKKIPGSAWSSWGGLHATVRKPRAESSRAAAVATCHALPVAREKKETERTCKCAGWTGAPGGACGTGVFVPPADT